MALPAKGTTHVRRVRSRREPRNFEKKTCFPNEWTAMKWMIPKGNR